MKALFIVNPASAAGATGRRVPELRAVAATVFDDFEVVQTQYAGHASEIAESRGADLLVSVGGDGTANEVVQGLSQRDRTARPSLAVLAAGTGSDLVKTLGTPPNLDRALRFIANTSAKPTDWLRVTMGAQTRVGINVMGFGMNGEVVRRANAGTKRLGGAATFALATLRTVMKWQHPQVVVRWEGPDGEGSWTGALASVFVANGQYCGGGMWVGRGGEMGDGLAEMTILPELPMQQMILGARKLYDGRIRTENGVVFARVQKLAAEVVGSARVLVDVDGEQPGVLPVRVSVEASALDVVRQ